MTIDISIIITLICAIFIALIDNKRLHEENHNLGMKLSQLADKTGNPECSLYYIDESTLDEIRTLKNQGKITKAVNKLRKKAPYSLVEAKEFVDML
ncbi:MAG: hypothetical protein ACRC3H_21330 [Lachnospiraceae bacterium]